MHNPYKSYNLKDIKGDSTETPTEVSHNEENLSWPDFVALLFHKWMMGTWECYKCDPGIITAKQSFFRKDQDGKSIYDRYKAVSLQEDIAVQFEQAKKLSEQRLSRNLKYERASPARRKVWERRELERALFDFAKPGAWAEQHYDKRVLAETNSILRRELKVAAEINIGDVVRNYNCCVFMEVPENGDVEVEHRHYIDVKRVNPVAIPGKTINVIAYGIHRSDALDELARELSPIPDEDTQAAEQWMPGLRTAW